MRTLYMTVAVIAFAHSAHAYDGAESTTSPRAINNAPSPSTSAPNPQSCEQAALLEDLRHDYRTPIPSDTDARERRCEEQPKPRRRNKG